jgi:hypothetical protein
VPTLRPRRAGSEPLRSKCSVQPLLRFMVDRIAIALALTFRRWTAAVPAGFTEAGRGRVGARSPEIRQVQGARPWDGVLREQDRARVGYAASRSVPKRRSLGSPPAWACSPTFQMKSRRAGSTEHSDDSGPTPLVRSVIAMWRSWTTSASAASCSVAPSTSRNPGRPNRTRPSNSAIRIGGQRQSIACRIVVAGTFARRSHRHVRRVQFASAVLRRAIAHPWRYARCASSVRSRPSLAAGRLARVGVVTASRS